VVAIGTLYPTLRSLEEKGLVKSDWGSADDRAAARRRYYRLTPEGHEAIDDIKTFQSRLLNWHPSY